MSDDLTGKVVVITGASGGIGEGTAYAMAAEGANVALLARRPEPLERVAAKARKLGVEVLAQAGDVSDRASVAEFVDQIEHELGVPDVLVNNAGINTVLRGVSDITMEDWDQVVDVNLTGPFNLVRAVLPAMKRNGGGLIINIVSLAGKTASTLAGAAYSASKFGLAGLTESINDEERKHGIRATAIFPGEVDTPILAGRPDPPSPDQVALALQAEDVAAAVVFVSKLPPRACVPEMLIRPSRTLDDLEKN